MNHRFFIKAEQKKDNYIIIKGKDYQHLALSLRLQQGDTIVVSEENNKLADYLVELVEFKDEEVIGEIKKIEKNKTETALDITMAQAVPKNRNMEFVIQKSTELGIKKIIPMLTERTIVRLSQKKEIKRLQRWRRIALEAAKQSQRGIIPAVTKIQNLEKIIINSDYDLVLLYWAAEKQNNFKKIVTEIEKKDISQILIIVGPEGGFSKKEVKMAVKKAGAYTVSLGPRILRTETAGIIALTTILYEFGELSFE